jgi:hypothetical protein
MDLLGSLDLSRSLQTRCVISFVIGLHLILQILKILLQKRKNAKCKVTLKEEERGLGDHDQDKENNTWIRSTTHTTQSHGERSTSTWMETGLGFSRTAFAQQAPALRLATSSKSRATPADRARDGGSSLSILS